MGSTDHEETKQPEEGEGASPEPEKTEGNDEPQTVPLSALHEERSKRKERDKELDETKTRLAELEKKLEAQAEPGEGLSPELMQELLQTHRQTKLGRELGLGEKQTNAVLEMMDKIPNLNPDQALILAKQAEPDVFNSDEGSGFDASQHGSLATTRGAPPLPQEEDDMPKRQERVKQLESTDSLAADELRNNMIGTLAAEALGIRHRKIPIE